jgi:hypothetical protein
MATVRTNAAEKRSREGRRKTATTAANAATWNAAPSTAQVKEFSGRSSRSLRAVAKGSGLPACVSPLVGVARGGGAGQPQILRCRACGPFVRGMRSARAAGCGARGSH